MAENKRLNDEIDEKQKKFAELNTRLLDLQDENQTIMKKHAANVKDLTKQLQMMQRKIDTPLPPPTPSSTLNRQSTYVDNELSGGNSVFKASSSSISEQNISSFLSSEPKNSHSSRTNSISSLNDPNNLIGLDSGRQPAVGSRSSIDSSAVNARYPELDEVYVVDVDKQKIIDKIVKLQKTLARRNEKIDFLQDHVNQLTQDTQRKTK